MNLSGGTSSSKEEEKINKNFNKFRSIYDKCKKQEEMLDNNYEKTLTTLHNAKNREKCIREMQEEIKDMTDEHDDVKREVENVEKHNPRDETGELLFDKTLDRHMHKTRMRNSDLLEKEICKSNMKLKKMKTQKQNQELGKKIEDLEMKACVLKSRQCLNSESLANVKPDYDKAFAEWKDLQRRQEVMMTLLIPFREETAIALKKMKVDATKGIVEPLIEDNKALGIIFQPNMFQITWSFLDKDVDLDLKRLKCIHRHLKETCLNLYWACTKRDIECKTRFWKHVDSLEVLKKVDSSEVENM